MYVWVHGCACLHVWRPDVNRKIDNSIIVVGKFNIFFSIMNRIPTKNKKKDLKCHYRSTSWNSHTKSFAHT